ncbi:DinB family protein [Marinigracilibium pacificum]|uniref:DinB family protein n=1 Tax=Marinigracilibium pacificum TaxID=2729599 RepID=A0A848IZ89_9BACT|nr:DinB family protein [Marinigracilibium pacificum]NMM47610.1 DinB family protein [Marinigracilibium pacificum]
MSSKLQHVIQTLKITFDGEPWYGESLMTKIKSINHDIVNDQVEGSNSIAKLIAHIIQWRIFVIEKLKGNADFDIKLNTAMDWPDTIIKNKTEWDHLIKKLLESQQEITDILSAKDDELLDEIVPGKEYNFHSLIEGIIHHDIYHSGQIGLIKSRVTQREDYDLYN